MAALQGAPRKRYSLCMTSPASPGGPDSGHPSPQDLTPTGPDETGPQGSDAPLGFRQSVAMALMIATPFALVGVIYMVLR